MKFNKANFGLAIKCPFVTPESENFRPLSWPPASDWPVMIDANGDVVSRYGDPIWRLDPWAKKAECLNFLGSRSKSQAQVSPQNVELLKIITAWWIWGPKGVRNAGTLVSKFVQIKKIFVLCSSNGILVSDLGRFPVIAEQIAEIVPPSHSGGLLTLLHDLYQNKETLGFTVLDRIGLIRLEATLSSQQYKQTPYIPPRIWTYQVNRLRACLDDFLENREKIEKCYEFCISAYTKNWGSLEAATRSRSDGKKSPFSQPKNRISKSGYVFHGPFKLTAERFEIDELLLRWVGSPGETELNSSVDILSTYLSLVRLAGLAYILNFSLMRIAEGESLRADCLNAEKDPRFGDIYVLRGVTTKTIDDDDACWPTSPSTRIAVQAMACIARMQQICATARHSAKMNAEDLRNPFLNQRNLEPWSRASAAHIKLSKRRQNYDVSIMRRFPGLFERAQMQVTADDLKIARLITPTLDPEKFAVGKIWPLAWHQLRRTGAVNMRASGLISDASLQYLLKHANRAMALYYGQGYSQLRLNDVARTLYVQTMYEMLGKEFARLLTDEFVSPHGNKRKIEIVRLIEPSDANKLTLLAKNGQLACRDILLGYCMNREPCPHGGIDSVAHCGGGDTGTPCADVLYDRDKAEKVKILESILDERLAKATKESPLQLSLLAQKRSIRNYENTTKKR